MSRDGPLTRLEYVDAVCVKVKKCWSATRNAPLVPCSAPTSLDLSPESWIADNSCSRTFVPESGGSIACLGYGSKGWYLLEIQKDQRILDVNEEIYNRQNVAIGQQGP